MDRVFKALADRNRRALLDQLFDSDGLTLGQLCTGALVSRQAVSKHLRLLEKAGLIVTYWQGREKLHYLNAIPIQEISERWISKYSRRRAGAVTALKRALEEQDNGKA